MLSTFKNQRVILTLETDPAMNKRHSLEEQMHDFLSSTSEQRRLRQSRVDLIEFCDFAQLNQLKLTVWTNQCSSKSDCLFSMLDMTKLDDIFMQSCDSQKTENEQNNLQCVGVNSNLNEDNVCLLLSNRFNVLQEPSVAMCHIKNILSSTQF